MNRPILPAFIKHYTGSEPTNQMVWYFAYKIVLKYAFQKYKGLRWDIAQFCCGGGWGDIMQHPVHLLIIGIKGQLNKMCTLNVEFFR